MFKVLLWILVTVTVLVGQYSFATNTNDWLWEAYDRSHNWAQNPYSSDVEADDLFNTNIALTIWWWNGWVWLNDSVIVRFARVLMRIAIVLAIPMILYSAIRIALAFGDEWKFQEALKHIWRVLWWVVLVLASVAIVLLISSLARNSVWLFSAWA
jgi:hypothetical protein